MKWTLLICAAICAAQVVANVTGFVYPSWAF